MRFDELIKAKGEAFITMKKKGKVLFTAHQSNMIVTNGLFIMANQLVGNFTNFTIGKMGIGDSNITTDANMVGLQGSNSRIEAGSGTDIMFDTANTTTFGTNQARFYFSISYNNNIAGQVFGTAPTYVGVTWPAGSAYTIKEFGIFTTLPVGGETMFNRIAWTGVDLYMNTDMSIDGYFVITLSQTGSN